MINISMTKIKSYLNQHKIVGIIMFYIFFLKNYESF